MDLKFLKGLLFFLLASNVVFAGEIPEKCFSMSGDIVYKYKCDYKDVTIPSSINGKKVLVITILRALIYQTLSRESNFMLSYTTN